MIIVSKRWRRVPLGHRRCAAPCARYRNCQTATASSFVHARVITPIHSNARWAISLRPLAGPGVEIAGGGVAVNRFSDAQILATAFQNPHRSPPNRLAGGAVESESEWRAGPKGGFETVLNGVDFDAHQHGQGPARDIVGTLGRTARIEAQIRIILPFEQRFAHPE